MPDKIAKQLDVLFAWSVFGGIQVKDYFEWFATFAHEHPNLIEGLNKMFWTMLCAILYHYVIRFLKRRDEANS